LIKNLILAFEISRYNKKKLLLKKARIPMKKVFILFLAVLLSSCGFIMKDGETVKAIGIKDRETKETLEFVDKKPEEEKTKVWPLGKPIEE
jgi:hypothetical protein